MDSCFSGIPAAAFTSLHSDIIQTHILTKLDGPTLASTSTASSQLHALCSDEYLWQNLCNTSWPSTTDPRVESIISTFPSGHLSFFSDSFPTIHQCHDQSGGFNWKNCPAAESPTRELISAVDVRCGDQLVYSKVVVTEALTGWFTCSPFRIDLVDIKEIVPTPVKFDGDEGRVMRRLEEEMRLSWIVIDPARRRAVNLSSHAPVEVRRHWLTGDIEVRYAAVAAGGGGVEGGLVKFGVVVTCGGKEGGELHVREISMQVEDLEGKMLSGKESLVILHMAMDGRRRRRRTHHDGETGWEEEKRRHVDFLEMRRIWRERKQRRERRLDLFCIAACVSIFMSFCSLLLWRGIQRL